MSFDPVVIHSVVVWVIYYCFLSCEHISCIAFCFKMWILNKFSNFFVQSKEVLRNLVCNSNNQKGLFQIRTMTISGVSLFSSYKSLLMIILSWLLTLCSLLSFTLYYVLCTVYHIPSTLYHLLSNHISWIFILSTCLSGGSFLKLK